MKRFTHVAASQLMELARIQDKIRKHARAIKQLEQAERNLKAAMPDYFDEGRTDVEYQGGQVVHVNYSTTERYVIDGDKVALFYAKQNRKLPMKRVPVVTFGATLQ